MNFLQSKSPLGITKAWSSEAVSQYEKPVIPDERSAAKRDPESRNVQQFQKLLDSGSRPVSRGLAGMTNCDTISLDQDIY